MSNYAKKERAKYWPVSPELMAQYRDGTHTIKDRYGNLYWQNQNNQMYRDGDKPAVIRADGYLIWFQNEVHRDGDKPAYITPDGELIWHQNGKTHRLHGPAVIYGDKLEWVIYDENITQEVNDWLAGEEWQGTPEQIVEFQLRFHRRFT